MNTIKHRYKQIAADPNGTLLWSGDEFLLEFSSTFSTAFCYMVARLWGIKLGKGNRFYGQSHFRRYPFSEIVIGSHCKFRSTFRSNFIGLNRPCGISTHSKNARIEIGDFCGFSAASLGAYRFIRIGNHVLCGANTVITDFDWHPIPNKDPLQSEVMAAAPIWIEDNVWLGMNCVVLKGVHIGKNVIVGANSVVTRSLPENVIAAGSPAKVIRCIEPERDEIHFPHPEAPVPAPQ